MSPAIVKEVDNENCHFSFPRMLNEECFNTNEDSVSSFTDSAPSLKKRSDFGLIIAAVPAYNEEKHISEVVIGCKSFVDRVVVINDGSSDATAMIATACGATVIYHEKNMGYGAAIRTCFETAQKMQANAMVILDADGQHNPAEIAQVLEPILLNEADVSIGSRFIEGHKSKIPFYREVGMKILDIVTNSGSGVRVSDTQSGFRAYSAKAINKIKISNNGMAAGSEILLQTKKYNLIVEEVPITCRYDIQNTSTYNPIIHGLKVLADVITEVEYKHPLYYIGLPGLLLFFTGFVNMWYVFKIYNIRGSLPFGPVISTTMFFTIGLLAVFTALNLHAMSKLLIQFSEK